MAKVSIKVYEDTKGNRWADFVSRNPQLNRPRHLLEKLAAALSKKLSAGKPFSREKIEQLASTPCLLPPKKAFKIPGDAKVFIIGCCFSRYTRSVLEQTGFDVYPKFFSLKFDPSVISVASIPKKYSLAWYSSFTIRQEFDKVFGFWRQAHDDIWVLKDNEFLWERYPQFKGKTIYSDPYRRHIFSIDKETLNKTTADIDELFREAVEKCSVLVLTLGLTEVWRKRDSGRICCAMPNFFDFEKENLCELVLGNYEDNYANLKHIADNLRSRYPQKKVIVMVAPVSVAASFSGNDIYLATEYSKAVLRLSAMRAAEDCENLYYFPAFEIFQLMNLSSRHRQDLFNNEAMRNLSLSSVEKIMAHFFKTYSDLSSWSVKKLQLSIDGEE